MSSIVSIITPLFNRVELVGETIDSVVTQTYPHWEMIIVDDGSTDGSYEYAQQWAQQDPRLQVLQRDRLPKGGSTCRNIGLARAKGDYIIFLDSDDLLAPHCLAQRVELFDQHSAYDFLVFPTRLFRQHPDDDGKILSRIFYQDYLTSFLLQSHWLTLQPIWRSAVIRELKGFDERLTCMQDGDLHRRALIKALKFNFFRNTFYSDSYFRRGDNSPRISSTKSLENVNSKVYAYQKLFAMLQEHRLLNPTRRTIIAAHLLDFCVSCRLMGHGKQAYRHWQLMYHGGITGRYEYWIGKLFIGLRAFRPIRKSHNRTRHLESIRRWLLPKLCLRHYRPA